MTLLRSARSLSLSLSRFLSPLAILAVSLTTGCGSGGEYCASKAQWEYRCDADHVKHGE